MGCSVSGIKVSAVKSDWRKDFDRILDILDGSNTVYDIEDNELQQYALEIVHKYSKQELVGNKSKAIASNLTKFMFTLLVENDLDKNWYYTYKSMINNIKQGKVVSYTDKTEYGKCLFKLNCLVVRNAVPKALLDIFESYNLNLNLINDTKCLLSILRSINASAYNRICNTVTQFNKNETFMDKVINKRKFQFMDISTHYFDIESLYRKDQISNGIVHYIWKNLRGLYEKRLDLSLELSYNEELIFRTFYDKKPNIFIAKEDFECLNKQILSLGYENFTDNVKSILSACKIYDMADMLNFMYSNSKIKDYIETMEKRAVFSVEHEKINVVNYNESYSRFTCTINSAYDMEYMHSYFKSIIANAMNKYGNIHQYVNGGSNAFGECYVKETKDEYNSKKNKKLTSQLFGLSELNKIKVQREHYATLFNQVEYGVVNNLEFALIHEESMLARDILRYAISKSNKVLKGLDYSTEDLKENQELINFWLTYNDLSIEKISIGLSKKVQNEYIRVFRLFSDYNKIIDADKLLDKLNLDDLNYVHDLSTICNGDIKGATLIKIRDFNNLLYNNIF